MGSSGSFSGSISLRKKRSVKVKKANSSEEIKEFINKYQNLGKPTAAHDLKKGDILLRIDAYDEYEETELDVTLKDIGLENVDAKEFMDKLMYEDYTEFEYFDFNFDNGDVDYTFHIKIENIEEKLKFVNLKMLDEEGLNGWSVHDIYNYYDDEHLASGSGWIYCGNDNSERDTFKITKKFIDSLKVGDELILDIDGDGEHC